MTSQTNKTSTLTYPRFVSIAVTGGVFLDGFKLDFDPAFTTLTGGTGSGKTTLLEVLAWSVQPEGEPASKHVVDNIADGMLRVVFETAPNMPYTVERTLKTTTVFDGRGNALTATPSQLMPVDYYRVKAISEMATNAAWKLRLIDRFAFEELREIESAIGGLERALTENAEEQARLLLAIRDRRDDAAEVSVLEEKLKGLAAAGSQASDLAAANDANGLRQQERHAITSALGALAKTREDAMRFSSALTRRFTSPVDDALLAGPNADLMTRVAAHIATARSACDKALGELGAACETAESAIRDRERTLASRHQDQDALYQNVLTQAKEHASRTEERTKLQQKLASALAARKAVEALQAERRIADAKQRDLFGRLCELRDRRYARRRAIAKEISDKLGPVIQVVIRQHADKKRFNALLTEKLKNSRLKYTTIVEKFIEFLTPDELADYVRREDAPALAERSGIDVERAKKVVEHLADPVTICEIELTELPDEPSIMLLDGELKDTSQLSTGQCCTTILPIILLAKGRPLLIDQPEDDIEGQHLCGVILPRLREVKLEHQIIAATHNPNVIVIGDCEKMVAQAADGRVARIRATGCVDEMKAYIQELEGGAKAFEERMKRYGY